MAIPLGHVGRRLRHAVDPGVTVTPPPVGARFERDVEVPVRDGTILRANVFRPDDDQPVPVIVCAHPYGKDHLPKPRRDGHGWHVPAQFRLLPQSEPFSISAWTSWEAPDPGFWVPRGYAIVNCDLRGWGRSDGVGELLSEQEAHDVHDVIEWAAVQPWSTGKVGMSGVSYLALTQWAAASLRPPHLAAISPWEGFTDAYADFARPGGVREDGFTILWTEMLRLQRRSPVSLRRELKARPLVDDWWQARNRDIERIDVPALVCGSFSDHNLHSRGSFEGFRRIGSARKWLYTHRGPKWATYYSDEAGAFQARFFDHFLKGTDNGMADVPPVRLEVRDSASTITSVREEQAWPPTNARWRDLELVADAPPGVPSVHAFDTRTGRATFSWELERDTEIVGSIRVRLHVEVRGGDDVFLFVGVRKLRGEREIGFEGSYGFDDDLVTHGMRKASQRDGDTVREPLHPGDIVPVEIELRPTATMFRAGDELRLDVQGHWFFARNPLFGQFPAGYERSPQATCVLHCGGPYDATLSVPVVV
ncbi:MAG TPA: CocE/NonD family hydrolase [Acidimicrobiia bacterium]|jgi:hypothetical protein